MPKMDFLPTSFMDVISIRGSRQLDTAATLLRLLSHSCVNNNIEIIRFASKKPIGYVAWISISSESLKMMKNTKSLPSYPHEWNEGKLTLIYDVCFLPGWQKLGIESLINSLKSKRFFSYFRRNKIHIFVRNNFKVSRKII